MEVSIRNDRTSPLINPWKMLIYLLLAQLMIAFIGRSVGPLGVLIGQDLSLSMSQIGMLPAALFFGQALASIPVGYMTDFFGSKKLLLAAVLCLGTGFAVMTFVSQFWLVLTVIAIGGIGYGAMHPVTNKGIVFWFPLKQRGTAMGIKQTGVTAGSALAALVLLPLSAEFGWREVLLPACLLLVIAGFISFYFYQDPPEQNKVKIDVGPRFFLGSILKMVKNKPLMLVSFSAMGLNGSQICLNAYIVLYSYKILGISLFLSGLLLVISEVSGSFGRIAWGMISDRVFQGNRVIVLLLITVMTAAASLTVVLMTAASFMMMVPIVAVFGFAVAGFNGIWMNLASEIVPREQSGISSGVSLTLGSAGVIIVPPLFGQVVDQTGNFAFGWLLITGIMLIVFVLLSYLSVLNKRNRLREEKKHGIQPK